MLAARWSVPPKQYRVLAHGQKSDIVHSFTKMHHGLTVCTRAPLCVLFPTTATALALWRLASDFCRLTTSCWEELKLSEAGRFGAAIPISCRWRPGCGVVLFSLVLPSNVISNDKYPGRSFWPVVPRWYSHRIYEAGSWVSSVEFRELCG